MLIPMKKGVGNVMERKGTASECHRILEKLATDL